MPPGLEVYAGGVLTEVKVLTAKKARNGANRFLRCKLEDLTGAIGCIMWPDDFARYKDEVGEDRVCVVKATVERNREAPGLLLTRILTPEQARQELTRAVKLSLTLGLHGPGTMDQLARTLERTPGACPVYLDVHDAAGKRCRLKLSEPYRINPTALATGELELILGPGRVEFIGPANGASRAASSR
jgi:DNA polymerase-3 subunit alpha